VLDNFWHNVYVIRIYLVYIIISDTQLYCSVPDYNAILECFDTVGNRPVDTRSVSMLVDRGGD